VPGGGDNKYRKEEESRRPSSANVELPREKLKGGGRVGGKDQDQTKWKVKSAASLKARADLEGKTGKRLKRGRKASHESKGKKEEDAKGVSNWG